MEQFSLRQATFNDLESILDVDLAANPDHPLLSPVPWPPGFNFRPMFLERRQHVIQDPKYGHVVAVDPSGSIVGFIAQTKQVVKTEQHYPEWEPTIPEGTNMEFLLAYMNARNEQKAKYFLEDMYGRLEPRVSLRAFTLLV
jgi:hypothetical protein